jgi:hypothetical protein
MLFGQVKGAQTDLFLLIVKLLPLVAEELAQFTCAKSESPQPTSVRLKEEGKTYQSWLRGSLASSSHASPG